LLPELTTDPTKINPVDLQAFNIFNNPPSPSGNSGNGLLPIPQARTVSPVGEQRSTAPLEAPLKSVEAEKDADVVQGFTPKNTRFGKDRYDAPLFQSSALANSRNNEGFQNPGNPTQNSPSQLPPLFSNDGDKPESKEKEKNKEQEARESFQKTMKEFAERTEDKEAFRLVDYFDLKNVIAKNESILTSFDDEEFDGRFIKNAQTIFERFSEKDSASDKKPFERFLKRMGPSTPVFRSQDLKQLKNSNNSEREYHRRESLE
ncbi:MAG: hypothetical protein ACKN9V_10980, partial [Pseudomonadota bacterium]